jgi:hypothetical protein
MDRVRGMISEPVKVIWCVLRVFEHSAQRAARNENLRRYTWLASCLFVFCFVLSSWFAAAQSIVSQYGFVVVWVGLMLLAYAVGGSMILKRPAIRTPLAMGFLIGVSFMFVMILLLVAVISGGDFATCQLLPENAPAERAVLAFAILLFINHVSSSRLARARVPTRPSQVLLTFLLVVFKDALLPEHGAAGADGAFPARGMYHDSEYPSSADHGRTAPGRADGGYDGAALHHADVDPGVDVGVDTSAVL